MAEKNVLLHNNDGSNNLYPKTKISLIEDANGDSLSADLTADDINDVVNKYKKPITGIPKSDLSSEVQTILEDVDNKVNKVEGKGLSSNDYTDEDKQKLSEINPEEMGKIDDVRVNGQSVVENKIANIDLSPLQPKMDNSLSTEDKTVVGGINETHALAVRKADPNGDYSESGGIFQYATNLIGKSGARAENDIVYRPTASQMSGTDWVAESIGGNLATIERIKGKTIKKNQILDGGDFSSADKWNRNHATFTVQDNIGTWTPEIVGSMSASLSKSTWGGCIDGHVYMLHMEINPNYEYNSQLYLGDKNSPITAQSNKWNYIDYISSPITDNYTRLICLYKKTADVLEEGSIVLIRNTMLIDLTDWFGAGDEPTTPEEAYARGVPRGYIDYNEGELLNLTATGLKTVGFNIFDKDTVKTSAGNKIKNDNGVEIADSNSSYFVEYIPVLPNMTYYRKANVSNGLQRIYYYDAEKNWISRTGSVGSTDSTFTTPKNCHFIQLQYSHATLNTGVWCIHLAWSGIRNGDYEPYWQNVLNLPIADYFEDGMKSAGTVHDELVKDKAIKRIGVVDLGSLDWTRGTITGDSTVYRFAAPIASKAVRNNMLCAKYTIKDTVGTSNMKNLELSGSNDSSNVFIRDDAYTDATAFKTAMSGVMLYYELADPVETLISPELNLNYRVDDFGTEEIVSTDDTAPMSADIIYQLDYEGNIRNMGQNMISKESMDSFISAFNSSGIGNISMTWDATNKKYNFTVSAPTPTEV